jgi:hypothetical protein
MHNATATHGKEKRIIGYAGMKHDGTIFMRVRERGVNTSHRGIVFCSPGDDNYVKLFAHLGGISPGQTEPVTPFII